MKLGEFFDRLAGAKTPQTTAPKDTADEEKQPKVRVPDTQKSLPFTKFAVTVVLIGASFLLGMAFQKDQDNHLTTKILGSAGSGSQSQSQNQSQGQNGFNGGSGGGFGGSFGGGSGGGYSADIVTAQVTSVSSTSITVQDSSGNSDTYSITANTVITDGGQPVSSSDIQTGDQVIVIPSRMDTSTARRIIVNPDTGSEPSIDPGETQSL